MRISQKSEYALRAMLELALRSDLTRAVRTADIARQQRIPEKFLELILVELRRAGLLVSHRGPVGGHRLARSPREITIGDVWRAIGGSLTESSARQSHTVFKPIWDRVNKAIADVVDDITLEDLGKEFESGRHVPDFNI
jgi:Rrf2 family protein